MNPKYEENAKLCYISTQSFIVYIKTDDFYNDIAEDAETRFDTSNYELEKPLPKTKNKKLIGLMQDILDGKNLEEFDGLRTKTYSYLIDYGSEDKKAKGTKMCIIKRKLKFRDHKGYLEATQLDNKINQLKINQLKNKVNVDSLKQDHKEFIKNNKLILKTQQRFKSKIHNVFTEDVSKIALS